MRSYKSNKKIGDISGTEIDFADTQQGMPIRSQFVPKRDITEDNRNDFDIYDETLPVPELNISSFDPTNNSLFDFNNFEKDSVPVSSVISSNQLGLFLFDNLTALTRNPTSILVSGLFTNLCNIWLGSKGQTYNNMRKYLNLSDKNNTYQTVLNNNNTINKSKFLDVKNVILVSDKYEINSKNNLTEIYAFSQNINLEVSKYNGYFNKIYHQYPEVVIKPNSLYNSDMLLLNIGIMKPVWATNWTSITKSNMQSKGEIYNYYEDTDIQVLELQMTDNVLSFGFILAKNNNNISIIDNIYYNKIIKLLKYKRMNHVVIPKFVQKTKLRLTSLLNATGFNTNNVDLTNFVKNNVKVNDVLQNFTLFIDDGHVPQKYERQAEASNRDFIVNKPFVYYARSQSNELVLVGHNTV